MKRYSSFASKRAAGRDAMNRERKNKTDQGIISKAHSQAIEKVMRRGFMRSCVRFHSAVLIIVFLLFLRVSPPPSSA